MKLDKKVEQVRATLDLYHQQMKELNEMFVYSRFDSDIPKVVVDGNGEMYLAYHCYEMSIETALDYMENIGYITPINFIL